MTKCKQCGTPIVEGLSDLCPSCIGKKLKAIREKMANPKKPEEQLTGFDGQTPEEPKTVEKVIEITPTGDAIEQPRQIFGSSLKQFYLFDPQTKEKIPVEATQNGEEYMALCPKHDDTNPSLSINPKKGLYYCHGCEFKGSLWDESKKHIPKDDEPDEPDKDGSKDPTGEILDTYDYCSANGTLLFQTVKLSAPPPRNKTFRQRRPDGKGGWVWNLKGTCLVPYRLPELLIGQDPVFICEGEKDVDNVRSLGLTATTNPMGAGKWKDIYNPALAGRDVVILPDNDEPGRKHSNEVSQSLFKTVKSIKVLILPDLPEKGDVSDWITAEKEAQGEKLLELAEATPLWEPPQDKWDGKNLFEILDSPIIQPNYLVEPILSAGDKGFLVAQYKKGKTLLMMDLALCLSMGGDWLGFKVLKPKKVLYIRFELKDVRFHQRLRLMTDAMGGREKVQAIPHFQYPLGFELTKKEDFDWLKRQIERHEPDALFLDPFYKLTSELDIKDPKNAMPLIRKFEELRGAYQDLLILMSHHDKKLNGTESDWDSAYGPMFFFADMDFEMKLIGGDGKFTLSFLSNDVPVEDIKIERDDKTLVHKFVGTESQNLREKVISILSEEGPLVRSTTIESMATIESVLKDKKIKFSPDKLADELNEGVKEGRYKKVPITATKRDGRTQKLWGYGING